MDYTREEVRRLCHNLLENPDDLESYNSLAILYRRVHPDISNAYPKYRETVPYENYRGQYSLLRSLWREDGGGIDYESMLTFDIEYNSVLYIQKLVRKGIQHNRTSPSESKRSIFDLNRVNCQKIEITKYLNALLILKAFIKNKPYHLIANYHQGYNFLVALEGKDKRIYRSYQTVISTDSNVRNRLKDWLYTYALYQIIRVFLEPHPLIGITFISTDKKYRAEFLGRLFGYTNVEVVKKLPEKDHLARAYCEYIRDRLADRVRNWMTTDKTLDELVRVIQEKSRKNIQLWRESNATP